MTCSCHLSARPAYPSVKLFSASRSISADNSGSVTIRDIVSAPIIVETATRARRLRVSGLALPNCPAMMSTSFRKPSVATARVFSSHPGELAADRGERAAGGRIVPVTGREVRRHGGVPGRVSRHPFDQRVHGLGTGLGDELVLRLEVLVEAAVGEPGGLHQVVEPGRDDPVLAELAGRGVTIRLRVCAASSLDFLMEVPPRD